MATVGTAILCATVLLPGQAAAEPRPSVGSVEQRLDALEHQAESAAERYNAAVDEAAEVDRRLAKVNAKVAASERSLAEVRQVVGRLAADSYRSGSLDPTLELLLSDRPEDFLSQASALRQLGERQSTALRRAGTARTRLAQDKLAVAQQLEQRTAVQRRLQQEKATIAAKVEESRTLLASLQAQERARLEAAQAAATRRSAAAARAARSAVRSGTLSASVAAPASANDDGNEPAAPAHSSDRARIAIETALAQVGDRYVYGGNGPSSFDCSGLTSFAYRAAGVALPRSSGAQYAAGRKVSRSELRPGDLVYFYSPISHVAIYLGNGQVVHASTPRTGVRVAAMNDRNYVGATRP